ncbi:MAG: hypothetical protein C4340_07010 [Armatimonadota bacterium]
MAQPTNTYTPAAGPRIRFEVIGEAWGEFMRNIGTWVVAQLVLLTIVAAIWFLGFFVVLTPAMLSGDTRAGFIASLFAYFVLLLLILLVSGVFTGGLFRMAIRQLRGEMPAVGDLFQSFDLAPRFIAAQLIIGVLTYVGFFLCIIPGLIFAGLTFLAYPILADQNVGSVGSIRMTWQALNMSWEALKKDWLMAILFFFVLAIVAEIGSIACGIGVVFTLPMFFLGIAIVYRDFFPERFAAQSTAPTGAPTPPAQPPAQPGM